MIENNAPEINVVKVVAEKYLKRIIHIERTPKGLSTYVYRVTTDDGVFYARFLPEDASFATEVLVHDRLRNTGISVPRVVGFEHKNDQTGLSVMFLEEIPGASIEEVWPQTGLRELLGEAGRQLACIHTIPVDGFGFIDRSSYQVLKGEKRSFDAYFTANLAYDLHALNRYPFSDLERTQITNDVNKARCLLDVPQAVLVHGDFDVSHIYHSNGTYKGIIDFGETGGNNQLYDLASFNVCSPSPDGIAYSYLIDGYREITQLTDEDIYAAELMALFILLRFLGKKAEVPGARDYFFRLAKKQLERINNI